MIFSSGLINRSYVRKPDRGTVRHRTNAVYGGFRVLDGPRMLLKKSRQNDPGGFRCGFDFKKMNRSVRIGVKQSVNVDTLLYKELKNFSSISFSLCLCLSRISILPCCRPGTNAAIPS